MSDSDQQAIGVIIADDHEVVRHGLRMLLDNRSDIRLLGEAASGQAAMRLALETRPQVALIDLQMPEGDGIAVIEGLRDALPTTAFIVLTSYGDDARIYAALRAGALGYLLKNVAGDALLQAVRGAARGEPQLHPEVARRLMQQVAPPTDPLAALSPREREVLRRLAQGRSNKEIAAVLGLAVETVKGHVSDILATLHVADRTQAALLAVRYGLVRFDQEIEP